MTDNFLFLRKVILLIIVIVSSTSIAQAKKLKKPMLLPVPIQTSLIVDAKSGQILHAKNAKIKTYPASLTKVMTVYLAFEAIESGKLSWYEQLPVSVNAEKMRPGKLGLRAGETIIVRDAILALIVKSANDAAVVLAEAIAGSEAKFARAMNKKAKQIGMYNSNFMNASGWHHPNQQTTAVDLAKLTIAIKKHHPRFYSLFAKTSFEFRGKTIIGHNKVVANYKGAEGLKTGYTIPAGFNLITTASRGNKALVAVVTGGKSAASRDKQMVQLLDQHFGVVPTKSIRLVSHKRKKKVKLASS